MTTAGLSNLVVEVLHNRGNDNHQEWSVGSGLFVGTKLVLTALHNVDGRGELLVRIHGAEEHRAEVCLQGDKDTIDLALLEVSNVMVDVPPLCYGAVDRSAPVVVKHCWAVGFPRFKERARNPKPLRLSTQVNGEIPTGENLDQPLLTLRVRNSPRPLPSSSVGESEWEGMSGAPAFSGNNIIVGVITEHHLPEGESALTVVPITAIDLLPEAEATKWWELLDVDRQAFVRLSGEAPSSLSISARPESFIPIPHSPLFQPRPDEFENLEHLLFESKREKPSPRLGLVGMAGVGKTQLAVELAHRCLDQNRFPAGIFWMTAMGEDLYDWQPRFAQLARDTGYLPPNEDISSAENERQRAIHFCRYLADHQDALLILDNVEDPSLVMMALPTLVGREVACSILYTSRITLSPEGATTYRLEPLSKENALRLLLQETREPLLTQIEAKLPNPEAKNARDICQSVGYLPLALKHLHDLLRRDRHLTLARLLQELTQRGALKLIQPLFPAFQLSWEQVQGEEAQHLFKLACYFPEAAPIPLWLLGLAAGLGEEGDILTQLGEARVELQELSLMEELSGDQVRLHPLVRDFGLRLVEGAGDKGKTLLEEAGERLAFALADLNTLGKRAQREGHWVCLEQVRAAYAYAERLGTSKAEDLKWIERWLDRESYLLGNKELWPEKVPGLFYQQLFNRSVEGGHPLSAKDAPARWLRQENQAGAEDQLLLRVFAGHSLSVNSVAFSPDGRQVLTGSGDRTARLWEASSGKLLRSFKVHAKYRVYSVAFSPDGRHVLTWSAAPRLWEASTGKLLTSLEGDFKVVHCVAFSPDRRQALTGSEYGMAHLWETSSGKLLRSFEVSSYRVYSVAFSPDGRHVLTGASSGTARLWEASTGKLLTSLEGHRISVLSVTFSPDGKLVMTCDQHGHVFLWQASGSEMGKLLGAYVAIYTVGAIYWLDMSHVVLVDTGGPSGRPHFYRLKLEGEW